MKNLCELERYRIKSQEILAMYGFLGDETCGAFSLKSPVDGGFLRIIASCGEGWDHVSVSRKGRCPNWQEMEHVKRMFFKEDEAAMQLHVATAEHINVHPFTLHIWRPQQCPIPKPPSWMVG